jgi:hypothetical protein
MVTQIYKEESTKKKMNKVLIILGISLLFIGVGSAAWYFVFGGDFRADVFSFSTDTKSVIMPFKDFSLNTTDSPDSKMVSAKFLYNKEGNFTIKIVESITDLSGGNCTGGSNDCKYLVSMWNGGDWDNSLINLNNTNLVHLPFNTGEKQINLTLSCVAYACPQTRSYSIRLEEIRV